MIHSRSRLRTAYFGSAAQQVRRTSAQVELVDQDCFVEVVGGAEGQLVESTEEVAAAVGGSAPGVPPRVGTVEQQHREEALDVLLAAQAEPGQQQVRILHASHPTT